MVWHSFLDKRRKAFLLLATLASSVVAGWTLPSEAAPAPAGAEIANQATATYVNATLGIMEIVKSNTVVATVANVPALDLTEGQTIRTARSTAAQYNFQATNTGNVPLFTEFSLSEMAGDNFDTAGDLLIDTNGNGVVDNTDRAIVPGQGFAMAPGERLSLIYRYTTPATVAADDVSIAELTARAVPQVGPSDPMTVGSQSRTVIDDIALLFSKEATLRAEEGEIDYSLVVRNNSETDLAAYDMLDGEELLVDGVQRSGVLVRDAIPLNTTLKVAAPAGGFVPYYHISGDAQHSYTSTLPATLSDVDAIAFIHEGDFGVGRSSDLGFTVTVSSSIDELDVINTAHAYIDDGGSTILRPSNQVITSISGEGPTVSFSSTAGGDPIENTPFDVNIYVNVNAAACNLTDEIDEVEVTVTTLFVQDLEVMIARETGPNTGIFEAAPLGILRATEAIRQNRVLEGMPGDTAGATATATCLGQSTTSSIGLQPGGFVFDSVTNDPVANARIAIFGPDGSVAPVVAAPGAITPSNVFLAETVTDDQGYFSLGTIAPGDYRMVVYPPVVYQHPSTRKAFPGFNRRVDPAMSYGLDFNFDGGPISNTDVPVDPMTGIPVALDKTADRSVVRRNGHVLYTLVARNRMDQALLNAAIRDTLPPGMQYIDGSARRDGVLIDDPTVEENGQLTFDLDMILPNATTEIIYGVKIGSAARRGNKTNVAYIEGNQAGTAISVRSTDARATVTVDDRGGVFSDKGTVIGRVFLDRDGNGVQTETDADGNPHDEPGIPGVKIVTSTGLTVVTDAEGRYSLFDLDPLTHVFALQSSTLPKGGQPMGVDTDDVLAPGSRLVDLKRGEVRAENFPIAWTPEAARDVAIRQDRFEGLDDAESRLRDDLPLGFGVNRSTSARSEAGLDTRTELLTDGTPANAVQAPEAPAFAPKMDIEEQIKTLDPALGFVGLADTTAAQSLSLTVRVKGPTKGKLRLELNGKAVGEDRVGARATYAQGGVQMMEYVALRLNTGENRLAAILTDPFGNDRGRKEIIVHGPGKPAGIVIVAPAEAPADSLARIPVIVRVVDEEGRLTRTPATVTLTAEKGAWDVRDIREETPGIQAYIDNGEATFDFIPPDLVGAETIGVESDFGRVKTDIGFTPNLDERVFVGVIEGAVGFGEGGAQIDGLMERNDISAFEETTQGTRGQLYLKGKILGRNLLTLRYDSDKDTDERLFRDIRSDEFYPVYGDNSERGFDAQSSSQLYVKVERDRSYILYGDLAVEAKADAFRLGAYRRSLTGGRAHIEQGMVTLDLFIAETDDTQQVIEIPGRGVSGPYAVDLTGGREGTEIVEIITRDRDQPSVILSTQRQTRLSDYTIDYFAGTLLFDRPVALRDTDLNPVSIRVTYEMQDGAGEDYLVYGGEVRVEPVEGIALGYREVHSDAPSLSDDARTIRAGYAEADFKGWGKAQVELAQTEDKAGETGWGARVSYELRAENHSIRADIARTDKAFDAPNASVGAGREEARLTTDHTITDGFGVATDSLYTRNLETDERRVGTEITGQVAVTPQVDIIAGGRAVETKRSGQTERVYSGIVGADYRPLFLPGAALRTEYEQDFRDTDNWRLTLGGDYQWNPALRLHALNEFSNAGGTAFGLGDFDDVNIVTKVGMEYQVTRDIGAFSEYRRSNGIASDGGIANGVKGRWDVTERTALRASAEHVEPIDQDDTRNSAVTFGAAYENEETGMIARADFEAERDDEGHGLYTNTALGYSLGKDLTLLARNRLAYDLRGEKRLRDRLRLGLAWRPERDQSLEGLALYEFEIDDAADTKEMVHRWSGALTFAPTDDLRTTAKYAGEHVAYRGASLTYDSTLHLAQAGLEYDFAKDSKGRDRFAIAGNVALFTDNAGDNVTAGIGVEVKANVMKNVQLGVGYNHIDVEEDRLRDLYRSGWYLRLRIKLDEGIWNTMDQIGITQELGLIAQK